MCLISFAVGAIAVFASLNDRYSKKNLNLEWKPYNHLSPHFLMHGALIMCHFLAVNFLPFLFLFEVNKTGGLIAALRGEKSSSS